LTAHLDITRWTTEIFAILEETFEKVQGIYLDKGTSLFETLAPVTAAEASQAISAHCASVAAQVFHVCYYLDVLSAHMRQQPPAAVDWAASWRVTTVSAEEWDDLRQHLRDTYQQVRELFQSRQDWSDDDDIGGALAIVVHTAYHLGEIRQALGVLLAPTLALPARTARHVGLNGAAERELVEEAAT